jgi:anti-anti-sigma factor
LREGLFVSGARDRDGGRLLSLRVRGEGERAVIVARGEVDLGTAGLLVRCGIRALEENPGPLVLDLARITFFSAAGLRALMELRAAAGERLLLRAPSRSVVFVLELTALTDRFAVLDEEPEQDWDEDPGGGPMQL